MSERETVLAKSGTVFRASTRWRAIAFFLAIASCAALRRSPSFS
jgi:hypothetical protein